MIKVEYRSLSSSSIVSLSSDFKLTNNFVLGELANNEGNPAKVQYIISNYSMVFNELLQRFRDIYGKPIDPTSGYRQPEYNKKVGGSSNSLHLQACAMDFVDKYKKYPEWMISTWLRILNSANYIGAINIYDNNGLYRYHVEAFSDVFLKAETSMLRVYTNGDQFTKLAAIYKPLGVEVTYHGK